MNIDFLSAGLTTKTLGRNVVYKESVSSTNDIAKSVCNDYADGTLVICDKQLNGRGRRGRSWLSNDGTLCMSLILKPQIDSAFLPRYTLACAVGINRALKEMGIESKIKWPNDILVNSKKLCGILFEGIFDSLGCRAIICGIGINVSGDFCDDELKKIATSVENEKGVHFEREEVAAKIINELELVFNSCCNNDDFEKLMEEYKKESCVFLKKVTIKRDEDIQGIVTGFDSFGRIELSGEYGKKLFDSGDVSLRC